MEMLSEKPVEAPAVRRWPSTRPLGLIAFSAAVVWATSITASTVKAIKIKPEHRAIKVTGSAKKRIASDLIEWEAVLEAHATDRTQAYKLVREEREKAVAFLAAQGIKPAEIQPQSTMVQEEWDTNVEMKMFPGAKEPTRIENKTFKGFVTREAIVVRSNDVPRVEKASREITSLLEQGVSITSAAPAYYYTRLGELKIEMLAAAGRDARARVDNILREAGGGSIKKLKKADMGIININPANSTKTSEEGNNDVSSYEKDIITIVHAEFDLED
jgi:uncharacterized protein